MPNQYIIIGGGISGLATAYFLKKKGHSIKLIEQSSNAGGKIKTENKNGFLLESGPNTVLYKEPALIQMIEELNLGSALVFPDSKVAGNRYVLTEKGIEQLPQGPGSLISSKLLSGKVKRRIASEYFRKYTGDIDKVSVADYFSEKFDRSLVDTIIGPFVSGIYAGDPQKLSFKYAFPSLYKNEKEHGSLLKGLMKSKKAAKKTKDDSKGSGIFSFTNGLQTLTDGLSQFLAEDIVLDTEVVNVAKQGQNSYAVELKSADSITKLECTDVVDTRDCKFLPDGLAPNKEIFDTIVYPPVITLHLAFKSSDVGNNDMGFGILCSKRAQKRFLGALFNSRIFPHVAPDGHELFTIMIGGARAPRLLQQPMGELISSVIREFSALMHISAEPIMENHVVWERSIPQYNLGYENVEAAILDFESQNNGYHLMGNYFNGISVPDCIKKAKDFAEKV